ncbi:MAG: short-chain dehydrogenase/reductase [Rhizobiales bacterium 24-66-13]|jgi:NAD(P)-dependent dehydrogenase (short-subunit alcohol dehydrogenase family)|nr:MAG: short-chain dehydrogenase/reductase [Rhizobiales bacterium 35-66-30]OYZ81790.1 MAG: short-chain dehydrogenase/reductase [Rhizobiales bacterium 24-66-13]OZB09653.1 MAG: short-chain dehydrogenase/reductase [Rhizobiales bacterium 39-66-18]HQS46944.1 SDR family oxidoreductase [Xanthobacteraceae bacterium]
MARTWLITGISSGFGREMAEQLLARGDRIAGTLRKLNAVEDLKAKYGDRLWTAQLDVTDVPAIHDVVSRAFAALGRIDVVVNNAGYGLFGAAEGLTDAQVRHQIDTNLIGPIQVTRAALPHLRAQGGGRVLALSTYGGQATYPGASLYHASKWGLEGFFDSLAGEVAAFNIGVTIVEPGGARTAFRSTASARMGAEPDAYKGTPISMIRSVLDDPKRMPNGDPIKMVRVMIDTVEQEPAPRRIVLGSDSYTMIEKALSERLTSVQTQKELAASTDFPPEE